MFTFAVTDGAARGADCQILTPHFCAHTSSTVISNVIYKPERFLLKYYICCYHDENKHTPDSRYKSFYRLVQTHKKKIPDYIKVGYKTICHTCPFDLCCTFKCGLCVNRSLFALK